MMNFNAFKHIPGLLVCLALCCSSSYIAIADEPANDGGSGLDAQLLDGLDDELMSDLEDLDLGDDSPPQSQPGDKKPLDDLDKQLIEELGRGAGEDVGTRGDTDPLTRIGERMSEVTRLINQADVGEPTREIQEEIVSDIEALIREARRRQGGSPSPNNDQQQQTADRSKVKQPQQQQQQPAQGSGSGEPNNQPAKDSTDRVEQGNVREADMQDMNELMRQVWGHLPQREREQMLQSTVDVFLPKYSTMIEEYFRRLAEMPEGSR